MKLNNTILVPTDFSEACSNATEHAIKFAEVYKFKLVLFHVINKDTPSLIKVENDVQTAVENKLKQVCNELKGLYEGIEIDYMFQEGSIFDLIPEVAAEIGANLIVLGTHGKKGLQYLLGSYALKVITKVEVPTIVVQKKPSAGYQNIMLPINSFTEARQKVGFAISVAKKFKATIHLFKEVVNDPGEMSRIEIITRQIVDILKKSETPYELIVSKQPGESAGELVSVAIAKNIDAIIIVTEPQLGTSIFSIGSWNEKIMFNEAQIPVICINPIEYGQIFLGL